MTDIKELALKTLDAMAEDGFHVYNITYEAGNKGFELDEPALAEYNKRLIAAYLAEQNKLCALNHLPPHPEPAPETHKHQGFYQSNIEPAPVWKDISGRCGGHNGEYDHQCLECGYITWFASYTDPNKENVACPKCHANPEPAPLACPFCGSKTGWHDRKCLNWKCDTETGEPIRDAVCAAPSSEEVREMVEWLRDCDHANKRRYRAADLIERLAAERDELLGPNPVEQMLRKQLAARVPDGCVVVRREVTEDARCVLATPGNYRTYQDQWNALIAAGEVKP